MFDWKIHKEALKNFGLLIMWLAILAVGFVVLLGTLTLIEWLWGLLGAVGHAVVIVSGIVAFAYWCCYELTKEQIRSNERWDEWVNPKPANFPAANSLALEGFKEASEELNKKSASSPTA